MTVMRKLQLLFLFSCLSSYLARAAKSSASASSSSSLFSSDAMYYISTNEGILSHLRQIDILWNSVSRFNRSILAVPFYSLHFPELPQISLCSLFLLPNEISCIQADNSTILKNTSSCVFTGAVHNPVSLYHQELKVDRNFSYAKAPCIAGSINLDVGYPPLVKRGNILKFPFFTEKYLALLSIARKILGFTEKTEYAVALWHNGDEEECSLELPPLAEGNGNGKFKFQRSHVNHEESFHQHENCRNKRTFMQRLSDEMKKHVHSRYLPLITYVATLDGNANNTVMANFRNNNLKTIDDLRVDLKKHDASLNALDEFMIEVMLICDATYFFAWGDSSSHNLYFHCRMLDHKKRHVTIIDDPHCIGNGHSINNYGSFEDDR
jgi:hypothetical protein